MGQIIFDEGADYMGANGLPATVRFLLSTKPTSGAGAHKVTDTLAGTGVGEITGTGYTRKSVARPEPSGSGEGLRAWTFPQMIWSTEAHTDWPKEVKSIVAVTTADNTGKALFAADLAAVRDLSGANTKEEVTPTYEF